MWLLAISCGASAQSTPQANPLRDLQDERTRDARQQRLNPEPETQLPVQVPTALDTEPSTLDDPQAQNFKRLDVEAHGLLQEEDLIQLLAPYRNIPLGPKRIELLLRQLKARLVEQGFVTSNAKIQTLDWQQGVLIIDLVAGKVVDLRSDQVPSVALKQVFPMQADDTLQLMDIEQGVQQINRLRLNQAEVKIIPGISPDTHSIDVSLPQLGMVWGSIGVDNYGSFTTGKIRTRASLNIENYFNRFESIGLTYLHTQRSRAFLAAASLPDGYNTWSASLAASDYSQSVLDEFTLNGQSYSASVAFHRTLLLTATRHDSIDISLNRTYSGRRFQSESLTPERLSTLRSAYTQVYKNNMVQVFGEVALAFGLPALGAQRDNTALTKQDAHAQFTKFELHGGIDTAIAHTNWRYSAQFDWQYSQQGLYGSEQFQLGGANTVRGFNEGVVSGERGWLLRQELRMPAFQFAPNSAANQSSEESSRSLSSSMQITLAPYVFADTGRAISVSDPTAKLSSFGAGIRAYANNTTRFDASFGRPTQKPANVDDYGWHIHFSLSHDW